MEKLIEALEEIKRTVELWKKADNMAGRIYHIADQAIRMSHEDGKGS